jgi:hypothetical protein
LPPRLHAGKGARIGGVGYRVARGAETRRDVTEIVRAKSLCFEMMALGAPAR